MFIYGDKEVKHRQSSITAPVKQTIDINSLFIAKIVSAINGKGVKILDIGTGNGFVLSRIIDAVDIESSTLKLVGIDNSPAMVEMAKNILKDKAEIYQADNNNLPFEDNSFYIITAKNVTRFNADELYRVLKPGGYFVFREYGSGKGLVEIAKLFEGRLIRNFPVEYYIEKISKAGLKIISLDSYELKRQYNSIEEIINITKSYPFIKDYSVDDEQVIRNMLGESTNITSDPFILVARKNNC